MRNQETREKKNLRLRKWKKISDWRIAKICQAAADCKAGFIWNRDLEKQLSQDPYFHLQKSDTEKWLELWLTALRRWNYSIVKQCYLTLRKYPLSIVKYFFLILRKVSSSPIASKLLYPLSVVVPLRFASKLLFLKKLWVLLVPNQKYELCRPMLPL